jgi:hypothetical protein
VEKEKRLQADGRAIGTATPFDAKEQKTHCQRIELKSEFENPNLGTGAL